MSEKATKANTGGQAASGTPDKERVRHNLTIAAGAIGRMQQCLGEQVNETLTTITPARTGKETPEQLAQQTADADLVERLVNVLRGDVSPLHVRIGGSEAAGLKLLCVWEQPLGGENRAG